MTQIPSPQEGDESFEQIDWTLASEESLRRVWENEYDAVYDNWQELYGVGTEHPTPGAIASAVQDERNEGSASPA